VVTFAPARPEDIQAIAHLLEELDQFYGGTITEPPGEQHAQIHEALFADGSIQALLAWDEATLVGIASYSLLWPAAGLTRCLFLKELYVAESHRRSGVGKLLMTRLHEEAEKKHCSRVEWMTETDNTAAQRFYEELGAKPQTGKIFYRRNLV
jgi:GNAT superfamily N-acetyltransferase